MLDALAQRLLERPAHEHLGQLPPVLGAAERVGRRRGALVGALGRGRRVGAAGQRLLDARGARSGVSPMFVSATAAEPFCWTAATPTIAQSIARRWNFW